MRIAWLHERYMDIALDRATWQEMSACLKRAGCHVTLATSYKKKPIDFGCSIVYLPCVRIKFLHYLTFNLSAILWLLRELHDWDAIIVEVNSVFSTLPLVLLRKIGLFKRGKLFLDLRTIPVHPSRFWYRLGELMISLAVRIAQRWFNGITVITPAMKSLIIKRYKLKSEQIGIWTSGVNLEHFDANAIPDEVCTNLRRELGLESKFVVMYHGTLPVNRGLHEVIRAIALTGAKIDALHLVFLGEGPARAQLEADAKRLGIYEQVIFLDPVDYNQIPRYLSLADVGILPFPDLPQWRVSSPLKLLEYLAMGKPVVLTYIEAHWSVLPKDHPCAFYAKTNQPEALAEAILQAYSTLTNQDHRRQCQTEGRTLIEKSFTWEAQAKNLLRYLNSDNVCQIQPCHLTDNDPEGCSNAKH